MTRYAMPDNLKAKQYSKVKNILFLINLIFDILLLAILIFFNLSSFIVGKVYYITNNLYVAVMLYVICISLLFLVIKFPLEFFSTFTIEHRFNLSNQTLLNWFKDQLKKTVLGFGIMLPIIEILYFFLNNYPKNWWIFVSFCWFIINIIISKLFPIVIVPMFYKYKDIEDSNLKNRLLRLFKNNNIKITNISQINLSKDTKKANAALIGIGSTRKVVLADTLISNYSSDEIEVVVAHELGHLKLNHISQLIIFGAVTTFAGLFITNFALWHLINIFGFTGIKDIAAMPLILLVLFLFGLVILPIQNAFSRYLENKADQFALNITGLKNAFISAMEKLANQNLSDTNPSKFIEFLLYDHPPIAKRIQLAQTFKQ